MLKALLNRFVKHKSNVGVATFCVKGQTARKAIAVLEKKRHKMFINFVNDDSATPFVGVCLHHDLQYMLIDIGEVTLPEEKLGEEIEVHFAAQEYGTSFYKFTTRIHNIQSKNGHTELLLALPGELICAQKRAFFRISPSQQSVRTLYVLRADDISFFPPNVGKESFFCDWPTPDWMVANISASGMCIKKRSKKKTPAFTMQPKDRLLCYLELNPMAGADSLRLWLMCKVIHSHTKEGYVRLGLKFVAWAKPVLPDHKNVWRKLDKTGGIEFLHRWVLKKQRKKYASLLSSM